MLVHCMARVRVNLSPIKTVHLPIKLPIVASMRCMPSIELFVLPRQLIWLTLVYMHRLASLPGCTVVYGKCTFLSCRPCEMFCASMKAVTRWWAGPASPQCGRRENMFSPRILRQRRRLHNYRVIKH